MATTKAQQKAVNKFVREHYDRFSITTPIGTKDAVQRHTATTGESMQGFILRAIRETMRRDQHKSCIMDDGIQPAILDYEQQRLQKTYEQRKAIIDATSYCGNIRTENPVWHDRKENKKAGE